MGLFRTISALAAAFAVGTLFGENGDYADNLAGYLANGRALDLAYSAAGRQLDSANYDLAEAVRQGKTVPPELLDEGKKLDAALRNRFLKLEEERAAIRNELYLRRAPSSYPVMVENIEDSASPDSEWIGFKSFTFKWADGTSFRVPLASFSVGVYRKNYAPFPTGEMLFVYGKRTPHRFAVTEAIPPAPVPAGPVELIIEGVDCDKGGNTAINLYVYGKKVFSGANPFRADKIGKLTIQLDSGLPATSDDSGKNLELMHKIADLAANIKNFEHESANMLKPFIDTAAPYRKNLHYRPQSSAEEIIDGKVFIRAIDVTDVSAGHSRLVHPGYNYDITHLPKHLAAAGANMASLIVKREIGGEAAKQARITAFAENSVIPFTVWADGAPFLDNDIISYQYYGRPEKMIADADAFISKYADLPLFAGLQVDEPAIRDNHHQFKKLIDFPDFLADYREFAVQRNPELASRGLPPLPDTPFSGTPQTAAEWVAYMEYQQFKANYAPESLKSFFEDVRARSLLPSIVIQNTVPLDTPACSYPAYGKNFDYIGTDLYNNGSLQEGIALQLLKNSCALQSTVIMWPGTGYACKSPRSFTRSLLNGLAWGDGLQLWTLVYCDKYRDANSFWQRGTQALTLDDLGGDLVNNWRPEYWDLLTGVFSFIAEHEEVLLQRTSVAPVALAVSERSLIAGIPTHANQNDYFDFVRIYAALAGQGVPLDAVFTEKLPLLERSPYHTLILYRAFALNDAEMKAIVEFVRTGGNLILCGDNGTRNEWNLPRVETLEERLSAIDGGVVEYFRAERVGREVKNLRDSGLPGTIAAEYRHKLTELTAGAKQVLPLSVMPPEGAVVSVRRAADGTYVYLVTDYQSNLNARDLECQITANCDLSLTAFDGLASGGAENIQKELKRGAVLSISYSGDLFIAVTMH